MKKLIIAEKKSVALELAAWIERHGAFGGGKASSEKNCVRVGGNIVSWCMGHLLEQAPPDAYNPIYEKWNMAHLPIIPDEFKLLPRKGAAEQLRAIGAYLKECDEVIHAGDAEDEGQLIVSEVLDYFNFKKPVQRLWLNAIDDTSITRAMKAMKSDSEYRGYKEAALGRSKSDWIVGINLTRAASMLGRKRGSKGVLSVGRVQIPTLALIVRREFEIKNFKPKDYYTSWIDLVSDPNFRAKWVAKNDDDRVDEEGRLLDRSVATSIASAAKSAAQAVVTEYSAKKALESQPLPFSLSSLQTHMSSKYGLGVQQTLNAAQGLYDKKLTSYPRTDCDYLPESQHIDAAQILSSLKGLDPAIDRAISGAKTSIRSRAWNDKKVTAHYAIIPLTRSSRAGLNRDEELVYKEVVKRYCIQFWPAAEYMDTLIALECAGEQYQVRGKRYLSMGWKGAFAEASTDEDQDDASDAKLPELKKGDTLKVFDAGFDSSRTKPPKRYTEGTLINTMKSVHRLIKNEKLRSILKEHTGIGTEATRAGIIGTLFERHYVKTTKKEIMPTEVGIRIIEALPPAITFPDLTAYWQQQMDGIRETGKSHQDFLFEQIEWVKKILPQLPEQFEKVAFGEIKPPLEIKDSEHVCPKCKRTKLKHINGKFGWFYACPDKECGARYKDKDGQPVEARQAQMTEHVCQSCKKGKLAVGEGKFGKYYRCVNAKCGQFFNEVDGQPEQYIQCPKCKKGALKKREGSKGPFWGCGNYKSGCKFSCNDKDGKPDLESSKK